MSPRKTYGSRNSPENQDQLPMVVPGDPPFPDERPFASSGTSDVTNDKWGVYTRAHISPAQEVTNKLWAQAAKGEIVAWQDL